jgi:DNA-binding response OmpR family regulator
MGQKVLVFESDPTFAADLRNELTKLGCSVQVVDDGNAGLQQATSARPDLILLSIELPRMNGFSVCNKLKKDPSLKDVPLIIMSSESSDETFEQHRKLRTRAEDYVHKPITFDDLLARIQPFVALQSGNGGAAAAEDYRAPQETSADEAEAEHPTGHPPARTSDALEEIDNGDIVIEEMPSQLPGARRSTRPPVAGDLVDHAEHVNVNGTASLDAALRAASEAPIPRTSDRPARTSSHAPAGLNDGAAQLAAGLQRDVEAAQAKIRDLEEALEHARAEAASAAETAGSVDTGEVERLRKDNEDLKTRLVAAGTASAAGAKGGVSSRDFLDLREALNKKDKEILSLREGLAKKDKEIVDVRDKSLAFERLKADLDDKVLEQERELAERQDKVDSLQADKEQAKKAGDDFKRRAERAQVETEAAKKELAELREKQGAELAARVADIATLKEEHAQNVEIERKAREASLAEAEARRAREVEEAATEKQTALDEAQRAAAEASAEAVGAREKALTGEHESKLATLHRAHQEEAQRLRTEHEQKIEALGKQHEEAAAQVASRHEAVLVDLREELESERDGRVAEAEAKGAAEIAAVRAEAAEKTAAAEREAAEKTAAAEREAAEKTAAAERDAAEKIAAAERDAAEKTAAFEKDFAEKIAAVEKDAAEKIAAAQAAGAARAHAAEEDAAQKIRAAEEQGATRAEAAEKDAAERIARAEEQAAAAKTTFDAQLAGLEDDLAATRSKASTYETRVTELEAAFASTSEAKNGFERDLEAAKQRVAILEADLAATRYSLDETKGHLVTQTNRLDKATTKIDADKTSLDRAKDALAVALSQIEEAESRTA